MSSDDITAPLYGGDGSNGYLRAIEVRTEVAVQAADILRAQVSAGILGSGMVRGAPNVKDIIALALWIMGPNDAEVESVMGSAPAVTEAPKTILNLYGVEFDKAQHGATLDVLSGKVTGFGEPEPLASLPKEVKALVHAVDRMRDRWSESDHAAKSELWQQMHSACDDVWTLVLCDYDRRDPSVEKEMFNRNPVIYERYRVMLDLVQHLRDKFYERPNAGNLDDEHVLHEWRMQLIDDVRESLLALRNAEKVRSREQVQQFKHREEAEREADIAATETAAAADEMADTFRTTFTGGM